MRSSTLATSSDVAIVNIEHTAHVDSVNICPYSWESWLAARATTPARKRADRYHHGDLRRALLQAAVRTIRSHGVDGLTLRGVGSTLGVSRTALYRHFTDKAALLAAGRRRRVPHAARGAASGVGGRRARACADSRPWAWPTSDSRSRIPRTTA